MVSTFNYESGMTSVKLLHLPTFRYIGIAMTLLVIPATGQRPTSRNPVNILKPLIYWDLVPALKKSNPGFRVKPGMTERGKDNPSSQE